jgi:4-amino-4-deoxy-L-arabinose transferase-like glycosyltransferase
MDKTDVVKTGDRAGARLLDLAVTWQQQLLILFVLTVTVRLVFALAVFPAIAPDSDLLNDDGYDRIARSLASGSGYVVEPGGPPTMKRVPLYPLFLAGVFKFLGPDIRVTQCVQAVVDGITVTVLCGITKEIFSSRAAWIAGGLFAFYPLSILYSARFYSEPLYTLLLCGFVYFLLKAIKGKARTWAVLAGSVLGCLALTRSVTLGLPVVLIPLVVWNSATPERTRAWLSSIIILLLMGLVLSPWVVRNYHLTGQVLVGGTTLGAPLYHGFYISQHWHWGQDLSKLHRRAFEERTALTSQQISEAPSLWSEFQANRIAIEAVKERVRRHPLQTLRMFLRNLVLVWFLTRQPLAMLVIGVIHGSLLLLAVWALWRLRRQKDESWRLVVPVLGVIAYFVVAHALVFPFVRYLAPIMPLVMVLSSAISGIKVPNVKSA